MTSNPYGFVPLQSGFPAALSSPVSTPHAASPLLALIPGPFFAEGFGLGYIREEDQYEDEGQDQGCGSGRPPPNELFSFIHNQQPGASHPSIPAQGHGNTEGMGTRTEQQMINVEGGNARQESEEIRRIQQNIRKREVQALARAKAATLGRTVCLLSESITPCTPHKVRVPPGPRSLPDLRPPFLPLNSGALNHWAFNPTLGRGCGYHRPRK